MSDLDDYAAKIGEARNVEREVDNLVGQIIKAAQTFGVPLGENWKRIIAPGMSRVSASASMTMNKGNLTDWPSMPQIAEKIRLYHQLILDAEAIYNKLTQDQRDIVPAPVVRR